MRIKKFYFFVKTNQIFNKIGLPLLGKWNRCKFLYFPTKYN